MNNNLENYLKLVSDEKSGWREKAQWRKENREWLTKSSAIAARILAVLREQGISQKDLAERMNVSPQHINKVVKGNENLSLETIAKIEMALSVRLIEVAGQTSVEYTLPKSVLGKADFVAEKIESIRVYQPLGFEEYVEYNDDLMVA